MSTARRHRATRGRTTDGSLLDVVLEGGGFAALASEMEARTERAALVLTAELELAAAGIRARALLGEAAVVALEHRLASLAAREARLVVGELAASHSSRPVELAELGLPSAIAIAARRANRLTAVLLLLAPGRDDLSSCPGDAVVDDARRALAMEALRLQAGREAIGSVGRDIVWELALGDARASRDIGARAAQAGLSSREPYWFLLVDAANGACEGLGAAIERIARQCRVTCMVLRRGAQHLVVAEAGRHPSIAQLEHRLLSEIDEPDLLVAAAEEPTLLAGLHEAYRTLNRMIAVARSLRWPRTRLERSALEPLSFLAAMAEGDAADGLLERVVGSLRAHDAHRRRDLEATLRAYLHAGGSISGAARSLRVDRRTLRRRLRQIETVTACDPTTPDGRFVLELATRIAGVRCMLEPASCGTSPSVT